MHSLILVVGDSIDEQLARFAAYNEVEPYRVVVDDDGRASMAEHFDLDADDLESLAAKMPEWDECEGEVHDGRLTYWSTANPEAMFDWYTVGGRFSGYLRLLTPRQQSFLGRLLGRKETDRVDSARKREVFAAPLLEEPPSALVADCIWLEQGWGKDALSKERWREQFAERFEQVPDDAQLTVVDIHL